MKNNSFANKRSSRKGFTLVELLMALTVSAIILAAVATLAYAASKANESTEELSLQS